MARNLWSKLVSIRLSQNTVLMILQLLGFFAALIGISLWSIPSAVILGGIAVVIVAEVQSNKAQPKPEDEKAIKETIDRLLKEGKNPFDGTVPVSQKWIEYAKLAAHRP